MHGGSTPQARQAAARRTSEDATREVTRRFAQPRSVTPVNALEEELARTQGWIDFLEQRIRESPKETAWVSVYQAERAQLARLAHQMIVTRTDERRLLLNERAMELLESALNGIVQELGHDPQSSYARGVVARYLRAAMNGDTPPDTASDGPSNVRPLPVRF